MQAIRPAHYRSGSSVWYARHGRDTCGVQVPCTRLGVSRRSAYQMITPIDKVLGEGNCGRVTDRGEEACECVGKPIENRRRPHSHQSCEATNRNVIQGRCGQASGPSITKPFPVNRKGKWRACAAKDHVLIRGDLESGSGLGVTPKPEPRNASSLAIPEVSRGHSTARHTPLAAGRAEP